MAARVAARLAAAGLALAGAVASPALAQDDPYRPPVLSGDDAAFAVTDRVVAPAPPKVGFNVHDTPFLPWKERPIVNLWNFWGTFEPAVVRHRSGVTGGSPRHLEVAWGEGGTGGLNHWRVLKDGFWDGGEAVVYRLENGAFRELRRSKVAKFTKADTESKPSDVPDRIEFADDGPAPRDGDEVLLTVTKLDPTADEVRTYEGGQNGPFRMIGPDGKTEASQSIDPETACPEGGSAASLRTEFAGAGSISQQWINTAQPKFATLIDGATYRWRGWMRQQGLPGGKVAVSLGKLAGETFDVTGEWQLYEFTFPAGEAPNALIRLAVEGAGTLWLDNMAVFDEAVPPFELYPHEFDKMAALDPGPVRVWELQHNVGFGTSLAADLGGGAWARPTMFTQRRLEPGSPLGLAGMLAVCERLGTDPWVITSTRYTPDEHRTLVEYLAGDASTPGGKLRADAGRDAPWSDAFGKIYLEVGNETWNANFNAQGFSGQPERYGAYAQMMFDAMAASPAFDDDKFVLVVNGWIAQPGESGFGAKAARAAAASEAFGLAPYLGGGWDVGGQLAGDRRAEYGLFHRRSFAESFEQAAAAARAIAADRGGPVQVVLYEYGPGYSLPGPNKPVDPAEETRGKSLGAALATIDQTLHARTLGFGPAAFFLYGEGDYWATHARGGRPHATWLGLGLLNRHAGGEVLAVDVASTVTADLSAAVVERRGRQVPQPAVPGVEAVQLYASRDGRSRSLVLLSLRADGDTPVTIDLPAPPAGEITVRSLVGDDIAASNSDAEDVRVEESTVKADGTTIRYDLPPHTMAVMTYEVAE